jgi:CO/xanthine dehydrogenase FAD-binding subunit
MNNFVYTRADDVLSAIRSSSQHAGAKYLGGGTNLVDLMRENIEQPAMLVDVTQLSNHIEDLEDGGIRIGAGVKNTEVANHQAVRERFPVLAQAILNGASGQIRNMATVGGNVMQRTLRTCVWHWPRWMRSYRLKAKRGRASASHSDPVPRPTLRPPRSTRSSCHGRSQGQAPQTPPRLSRSQACLNGSVSPHHSCSTRTPGPSPPWGVHPRVKLVVFTTSILVGKIFERSCPPGYLLYFRQNTVGIYTPT